MNLHIPAAKKEPEPTFHSLWPTGPSGPFGPSLRVFPVFGEKTDLSANVGYALGSFAKAVKSRKPQNIGPSGPYLRVSANGPGPIDMQADGPFI